MGTLYQQTYINLLYILNYKYKPNKQIMRFIIDVLLTGLAVFLAALVLPDSAVSVAGFGWAIVAGLIISFVNATVGTVLRIFTLPLNLLTLGLISFIITVLMVQLTSYFMGSKFDVANFWWAAVFALVVALIQMLLGGLFKSKDRD